MIAVPGLAARERSLVVGRPTRDGGQAEAAERILAAAAPLLYGAGIRAVSADVVIEAAGVTKATFYRHFPTKDDLVVAYVRAVAAEERRTLEAWRSELAGRPDLVLVRYARTLGREACGAGFRGCPFLNAVAEHPEPSHPVHRAAQEHRIWLRTVATELVAEVLAGSPAARGSSGSRGARGLERHVDRRAVRVALQLVMLRDGALAAGPDVGPGERAAGLLRGGTALIGGAFATSGA